MKIQLLTTSRFAAPLPWKTFPNYFCRICHWMYLFSMTLPRTFQANCVFYYKRIILVLIWWVFPGVFSRFVNRAWNGTNTVQVGKLSVEFIACTTPNTYLWLFDMSHLQHDDECCHATPSPVDFSGKNKFIILVRWARQREKPRSMKSNEWNTDPAMT